MIEGNRLAVVVNGSPNGRAVNRPSVVPARGRLDLLPLGFTVAAPEADEEERLPASGARCRLAMAYVD
ncbi:hypothetical protein ACFC1R_26760 [Kitasatospora sp. NPDC056138]|uniref:hypothetical protein n=1 Tax=Kitasatospora sp. NPDC056138 TaxID=3345724 RepID=UPI0035D86E90